MAAAADLLIGEFVRTLDERFRLAVPQELLDPLLSSGPKLVIAKERAGCLSLWSAALWKPKLEAAVDVVRSKMEAGLLANRVGQLQELGRLLSTRHQTVTLAGRRGSCCRRDSASFSVSSPDPTSWWWARLYASSSGSPPPGPPTSRARCPASAAASTS